MKKFISIVLALVMMFALSINAFAAVWSFGTYASGSYPFAPRGYSIEYYDANGNVQHDWLSSDFTHNGTSGNQRCAVLGDEDNEIASIDDEDIIAIYAWFDKNPTGSALSGSTYAYKDFLVYSSNGGTPTSKISSISGVTIDNASRGVTDPDGSTNQWSIKITMTSYPTGNCVFGFNRGFQANNGISLALIDVPVGNQTGYIGYVKNAATDSEQALYNAQKNTIYKYVNPDSLTTAIGTTTYEGTTYDVYDLQFVDFYHSITVS